MRAKISTAATLGLAILTILTTACGGSSKSPVSPSSPADVGVPGGTSAAGAVIAGTVQGAGASAFTSATTGHAAGSVTVSVVGTSLSTTVDTAGRFALNGVPAGDVQLRFTATGVDAMLSIPGVRTSDTINLVVTLASNSATVESEVRNGAEQDQELEGRVEALPPTVASGSLRVGGRLVKTDGSTRIRQADTPKTFSDLAINQRVHVRGRASGADILAALIDIQSTNTAVPAEINGSIDTLTGNASSFQFKIGSRVVKGDMTSDFFGDGDRGTTFSALRNGLRVEVKGEQRDGFIFATRIHVENEAEPGDDNGDDNGDQNDDHGNGGNGGDDHGKQPTEVEASGAVGGLQGSCPTVSFTLGGNRVTTNASTKFDGAACSTYKNGDKAEMSGTRQSDGSVVATKLKKK